VADVAFAALGGGQAPNLNRDHFACLSATWARLSKSAVLKLSTTSPDQLHRKQRAWKRRITNALFVDEFVPLMG
jgi:hypothetical protein